MEAPKTDRPTMNPPREVSAAAEATPTTAPIASESATHGPFLKTSGQRVVAPAKRSNTTAVITDPARISRIPCRRRGGACSSLRNGKKAANTARTNARSGRTRLFVIWVTHPCVKFVVYVYYSTRIVDLQPEFCLTNKVRGNHHQT